ncbi:hypothetical protein [Hymenobacter rubidus]|uniref:hypothetical protein n=1 Tax=Hymenobacter rubidus TaxID=1441626 RepID=UPI00191D606B|nr:hypothetical protein [Hymenobacter rubidus]
MQKHVGTFAVEDCFWLASRGWVLVGTVVGQVVEGHQLVFANGTALSVDAVETLRVAEGEKDALVSQSPSLGQSDKLETQIVGLTAQIVA